MSILIALPLGKIIGAGFAGVAIASPFVIKHLSNSGVENKTQERVENKVANCWLVMQGTDQQKPDQDKQLIVCKDGTGEGEETREEGKTPKAKYYLRPETDKTTKKEVESIAIKNQNEVTLTLIKDKNDSGPSPANNQEGIRITQTWDLGDNLTLNRDCRIAWQEENGDRKKLICTPASNKYRWLDPIDD